MRAVFAVLAALSLASCARSEPVHPQVIELFQSQGCSSCPPANAVLNALADRHDLITLSFGVTYWDKLGWKDSFATPAYTQRQYDYAHGLGRNGVQTPQMVINGRGAITGSRPGEVAAALMTYARKGPEPEIELSGGSLSIGKLDHATPANVWLVRYDPNTLDVPIKAGENAGRTLPHRHVVKQMITLGSWSGGATRFAVPDAAGGLKTAILLQAGTGGPIIAAQAF